MPFSEPLKTQVRKKAHSACCLCKSFGAEVHHIVPESEGGSDTQENAVPLCPSCYETYGANPQKRNFIREARNTWYEICENRSTQKQPRTVEEISSAIDEFVDKIWYDRHQSLKHRIETGQETVNADVWLEAQEAASKIEAKYPKSELGPHSDFEWGLINGKLSALRWVTGDEWNFLDT